MLRPENNITDPNIYHVPTANPIILIPLIFEAIPHFLRRFFQLRLDYSFPYSLLYDLANIRVNQTELATVCSIALILTLLRYILENKCKLWVARWEVFPRFEHKLPETIWKLLFYSSAWLFSLFVQLYVEGAESFRDPLSMWIGWESGYPPPIAPEVTAVYALQAGYYLHSVYATLFMDLWRKDSWLMFFHHFIALALLLLSYVGHFVLPGVLLVFLHDSSDAALEITKLGHYLKKRKNGDSYPWWNILGITSFILFAILWIIFRLYFYSCKLLYSTLYGAVYLGPQDAAFFPLLGLMLTMIFCMNIYWFNFIVRMVVRVVLTGEDPEDNREFDTTAVSGIDKGELDKLAKKDR